MFKFNKNKQDEDELPSEELESDSKKGKFNNFKAPSRKNFSKGKTRDSRESTPQSVRDINVGTSNLRGGKFTLEKETLMEQVVVSRNGDIYTVISSSQNSAQDWRIAESKLPNAPTTDKIQNELLQPNFLSNDPAYIEGEVRVWEHGTRVQYVQKTVDGKTQDWILTDFTKETKVHLDGIKALDMQLDISSTTNLSYKGIHIGDQGKSLVEKGYTTDHLAHGAMFGSFEHDLFIFMAYVIAWRSVFSHIEAIAKKYPSKATWLYWLASEMQRSAHTSAIDNAINALKSYELHIDLTKFAKEIFPLLEVSSEGDRIDTPVIATRVLLYGLVAPLSFEPDGSNSYMSSVHYETPDDAEVSFPDLGSRDVSKGGHFIIREITDKISLPEVITTLLTEGSFDSFKTTMISKLNSFDKYVEQFAVAFPITHMPLISLFSFLKGTTFMKVNNLVPFVMETQRMWFNKRGLVQKQFRYWEHIELIFDQMGSGIDEGIKFDASRQLMTIQRPLKIMGKVNSAYSNSDVLLRAPMNESVIAQTDSSKPEAWLGRYDNSQLINSSDPTAGKKVKTTDRTATKAIKLSIGKRVIQPDGDLTSKYKEFFGSSVFKVITIGALNPSSSLSSAIYYVGELGTELPENTVAPSDRSVSKLSLYIRKFTIKFTSGLGKQNVTYYNPKEVMVTEQRIIFWVELITDYFAGKAVFPAINMNIKANFNSN